MFRGERAGSRLFDVTVSERRNLKCATRRAGGKGGEGAGGGGWEGMYGWRVKRNEIKPNARGCACASVKKRKRKKAFESIFLKVLYC